MFSLEGVTRCWSAIINAEKKNNTRNRGMGRLGEERKI